ncbi:MAG: hypothetical protein NW226_07345 [Microscillaceae bacterium]|nr:hypothetical protein [Microscillaceae bacterium]
MIRHSEEKRESIRRLIRSRLLNLEQIAAIQEVPLEYVQQIASEMPHKPDAKV